MTCPACGGGRTLTLDRTPDGLRVRRCAGCSGCWLRSEDYWRWRANDPSITGPSGRSDGGPAPDPDADRPGFRTCPEDSYMLARIRVGGPPAFSIEQCRHCSGTWFDPGEWESLVSRGLSDELYELLSEEWQERFRAGGREAAEPEQWLKRLGESDFSRISEVKEWLDHHPKRSELYAFLRFHDRAV